jgi:hypothetical protein
MCDNDTVSRGVPAKGVGGARRCEATAGAY